MALTFTTKRKLQRIGMVALTLLLAGIVVWFCWVIWLERYVVYTDEGASLNFDLEDPGTGQLAAPPSSAETISIYFNEGENAIDATYELAQISGYYISGDDLKDDIAGTRELLSTLGSGTAVMIEVKNIKGSFYYSSGLSDAVYASTVDLAAVDSLIQDMNSRNLYTIACLPAFRDWSYGLNHVSSGLAVPKKGYLWVDDAGCYWLDPTDSGTMSWLYAIVGELRDLGFDEVVFTDFRFPDTTNIAFDGDKTEAITTAAAKLVTTCAKDNFAVSFVASDTGFTLPEGRTRMYLQNVGAKDVASLVAQVTVPDIAVNLVFLSSTNDTRFNDYSVLRPIVTAQDDQAKN
ncbi:MAG: hypothetical protein IJ375_03680 [Oscillospiraceae bacterium]|nr:hypothetical protein [Oscillospiraceae bacterium]